LKNRLQRYAFFFDYSQDSNGFIIFVANFRIQQLRDEKIIVGLFGIGHGLGG
jgi:hypothetical protein